jgi:hypothetical protein
MNDADLGARARQLLGRTRSPGDIAHLFSLSDDLLDSSTDRATALEALIRARDADASTATVRQIDPSTGDPWRGSPSLTEVALTVQTNVVVHLELEPNPRVSLVSWRQVGAAPPPGLEIVLHWAEGPGGDPHAPMVALAKAVHSLSVGVPFSAGAILAVVAQRFEELSAVMSSGAIRELLNLATAQIESELRALPDDVLRRVNNLSRVLREWETECVRVWPESKQRWQTLNSSVPVALDSPDPADSLNQAAQLLLASAPTPTRPALRAYRGRTKAETGVPLTLLSPRLAMSGMFDAHLRPALRTETKRNSIALAVAAPIGRWAELAKHRLTSPNSTRMSGQDLREHLWWRLASRLALGRSVPDPLPTSVQAYLPALRAVLLRRGEAEVQLDLVLDPTMSYVATLPIDLDAGDSLIISLASEALDDPLGFRRWGDALSLMGSWAVASQAYGCAYALSDVDTEIGDRRDASTIAFAALMSAKSARCARRTDAPDHDSDDLTRIAMTLSPRVAREALSADGGRDEYDDPIHLGAVRRTLGAIVERQLAIDFDGRLLPDVREIGETMVALDRFLLRFD